jgi:NAD(P)-dependent dehydrogenase (short-subunit alcohol dehydrogenase family)
MNAESAEQRGRFGLTGTIALVTGASRGIGRALALGMAEAGADVVGAARDEAALGALEREVVGRGRRFLAVAADLSTDEGVRRTAELAWGWRGRLDVLVNAAGTIVRSEVPEVTPEQWDRVFALNVRGPFFLSQAVGGRMYDGQGGAIVNLTSVAAEVATGASSVYASSKAALVQLTRVLAVRWAPRVRVNAVGPSYIATALNRQWLEADENRRFVLDRTPLGRVGDVDDVVGAAVFLASPAASYITGHHLLVDGGWTAQ